MSRPCVECGSSFRVLHKSADLVVPVFYASPSLSGSGSQGLGRTLPVCSVHFPSEVSSPGSQRLGHTFPGCGAPFPSSAPGPTSRHRSGLRKSLNRNREPVCHVGGVASLGLSLPLSSPPCLLPPAGMGRLFSGVSQSLCFTNRRQCVPAG